MEKFWFKAKRYGYGWYPASPEGWTVMLCYITLMFMPLSLALWAKQDVDDESFAPIFVVYAAILTATLLLICVKKGETARWRWGK
jgi:hypothetical protein